MASSKGTTTKFSDDVQQINMETINLRDDTDEPKSGNLRRASTDAHETPYRPQLRVRFHTLSPGIGRQFSDEEFELLSSKAHEIGPANWSGGWQNTVFRRRRQGKMPQSAEEEVQEITQAMEEDQKLMADDVDGEVLRREALRELTKSLRVKREIKERLSVSRSTLQRGSRRNISFFQSLKYSCSMKMFHMKESIKTTLHDYSLWHKDLKDIEGIYGSSVGSYFRFLRYLFIINSFIALVIIGFLLVPQLLEDHRVNSAPQVPEDSHGNLTASAIVYEDDSPYITDPPNNATFGFMDLLTGTGWFCDTGLYYGGYSTGLILSGEGANSSSYDMSYVYFFTMSTCYAFYLIVMLYKIFNLYRVNYIDNEEDVSVAFVEKVFSSWDFTITDEKSASIKRRSVYNELIELLQEYLREEEVEGVIERIVKRVGQVLTWFVLVSFMLFLGWVLYIFLKYQLQDLANYEEGYVVESIELLMYPFIVSLLMVIIPLAFEVITKIEKYSKPRIELYVNLIRKFILMTIILVVLFVFWYEKSPGLNKELKTLEEQLEMAPSIDYHGEKEPLHMNLTSVECWESALGQEIYRLVFVDFFVILISTLVVDSLKTYLVRKGKAKETILLFCIPRNTVHIIYNQTLLWAGIFFCPLLPLIISLKFFITFYLQKFTVTRNLRPIDRPWRAAQTQTLFYALTLLSLILAIGSFGFIVVRGYSSKTCGPFQGYEHYMDVIWYETGEGGKVLARVVEYFFRPSSIFISIFIVIIIVYCIKNISEGRAELVKVLRRQLELEMNDRVFLQNLIEKVLRGEYPRRPNSPLRSAPTSPGAPVGTETEPKNLSKKSSFIFSRSIGLDEVDCVGETQF